MRTYDDVETKTLTHREAGQEALIEEFRADDDVFMMGEGISGGSDFRIVDASFSDEFGEDRIRDVPISEAGFVGTAVGAAMSGSRPITTMGFSDFLGIAMEQLMNQASKVQYMFDGELSVPLTVHALEGAGFSAGAQHSKSYHTLYSHIPGLKVVTPGTPAAEKGLLKASIRSDDPVMFLGNKSILNLEGEVPAEDDFVLPLGEASVEREGADVTVVAVHEMLRFALEAADDLQDDVDVEVIDPRTLYPLDTETILESVEKTGRLVVADETPLSYGSQAEIASRVAESGFKYLDAPVRRVGIPDVPSPFNPDLENEVIPDKADITRAIESVSE